MRLPNLHETPHYFIVQSIGGMYEGYSETNCDRISDKESPEHAKAMVEDYVDQWMHSMVEYYTNLAEEMMVPMKDVKFKHIECPHKFWHKVEVDLGDSDPLDKFESAQTLFIQTYLGKSIDHQVVVYDQMNDMVDIVCAKHTAMHLAEETISLDAQRIKARLLDDKSKLLDTTYYVNNLIYCYDSLAEVVRDLESSHPVMLDLDDSCTHYFPAESVKKMFYGWNNGKIATNH